MMNDVISRQTVLDIVDDLRDRMTVVGYWSVVERVKALPSAQPEQRWIPCSEKLPEDGERVLATHLGGLNPDRQVIEHIYKNGEFTLGWDMDMNMDSPTFGQRYMGKVIAWMPLPEPYREGD